MASEPVGARSGSAGLLVTPTTLQPRVHTPGEVSGVGAAEGGEGGGGEAHAASPKSEEGGGGTERRSREWWDAPQTEGRLPASKSVPLMNDDHDAPGPGRAHSHSAESTRVADSPKVTPKSDRGARGGSDVVPDRYPPWRRAEGKS